MGNTCKKCGHVRQESCEGPDYQCPSCGSVYAKTDAYLNRIEQSLQKRKGSDDLASRSKELEALYRGVSLADLLNVQEKAVLPPGISDIFSELIARRKLAPHLMRNTAEPKMVHRTSVITKVDTGLEPVRRDVKKRMAIAVLLLAFALTTSYVFMLHRPLQDGILKDKYSRICIEIAQISSIRPSSVEVNSISSSQKTLDLPAAVASVKAKKFTTPGLEEDLLKMVDERYQKNTPFKQTSIFVDYSAENRLGGSTRDVILCVFSEDTFHTELSEVAIGNKRYFRDNSFRELNLVGHRPDGLDIMNYVQEVTMKDRLRYWFSPVQ